jgi:hypothetical protein
MTGHGGGHGDFGRFCVSDFSNHDHIWILPKDGSKRRWKGQPCSWTDLDLIDPRNPVFYRILQRDDVKRDMVHLPDGSKQGGALPTSGWTDHE